MTIITEMAEKAGLMQRRASKGASASWKKEVYHLPEEFENKPEWEAIEKVVKARDKHTCQSCRIKIGLTVHHILPREEGGKDYPPNLITLCFRCHNEIEGLGLREKLQIRDFKYGRKYVKHDPAISTKDAPVKWQQWVYGGYSKPKTA